MTEKKIVRLAMIRGNSDDPCPFGLPIDLACRNVGNLVDSMLPANYSLDDQSAPELTAEEKQMRLQTNQQLFRWRAPGERCKHAAKFFKKENPLFQEHPKVNCLWNDGDSGIDMGASLLGSPFYYRHFSGVGLDGLYSLPSSSYVDTSIDRSHFYGVWAMEELQEERKKNG